MLEIVPAHGFCVCCLCLSFCLPVCPFVMSVPVFSVYQFVCLIVRLFFVCRACHVSFYLCACFFVCFCVFMECWLSLVMLV